MTEIIMKAARELGISSNVSVAPFDGVIDPLVTVAYTPRAVQGRIPARYLMDESLETVKAILVDMARAAKN